MSVEAALRSLLRDRLTAAMDQVLTRVLQELDRALEDFKAGSETQEEPLERLMVCSAGIQFPEPQVKQEPVKESGSVSELQLPEFPWVKQEPTDRGCCLSAAAEVEELNEIQIHFVTSLNTCKDLNACQCLSSDLGLEKTEKCYVLQQSASATCSSSGVKAPESPQVQQEPTDRGRCLSGPAKVEEFNLHQSNVPIDCLTSLNAVTSLDACNVPLESSEQRPNLNSDKEKEGSCSDHPQCDSRGCLNFPENDKMESNPQEQSANDQNSPYAFSLKMPVIKLHPLFPRSDSKNERMFPKNKEIIPVRKSKKEMVKKRGRMARHAVKYMCLCGKLLSKEALEVHQTPTDGEGRPFGCPSSVKPLCEAFSVKRSRQKVEDPKGNYENNFQTGQSKVLEHGEVTDDFRNETGQRDEGILKNFRQAFLNKSSSTNANEKSKVWEDEAKPHAEAQTGEPLGSGHSGEAGALFSCDVCGHGFSWLPRLYQHRKEHFDARSFWCSDCGRTFRALRDLRTHLCVQTGKKPYSCPVCKETFFLKIHLQTHMVHHRQAQRRALKSNSPPNQLF